MADENERDRLFQTILSKPNVFYKSQQRNEPDFQLDQKKLILNELFESQPHVFLERYHKYITREFLSFFPSTDRCRPYLEIIDKQTEAESKCVVRNRRFLMLEKLKKSNDYFSLSKMRERNPYLFDTMIGDHLNDLENMSLRPAVEPGSSNTFSSLMEQFDESQRITERRKRHFAEWESDDRTDRLMSHAAQRMSVDDEFEMEFDSDSEENRDGGVKRKRCLSRYTVDKEIPKLIFSESEPSTNNRLVDDFTDETARQMSELRMDEEDAYPERLENTTEIVEEKVKTDFAEVDHEVLIEEFRSIMEQHFLNGKDDQFVDYDEIDNDETSIQLSKWKEHDLEDSYFADTES